MSEEEIINQAGGRTQFTYDLMWNVTSVTDPNGNTVRYVYDQYQRVVQSIDEEGNTTRYEHDPKGNVTAVISPMGARTEIKYDALDRQTEVIEPDNARTKLAYDKAGNLISVTDALGNVTKREYDLANQLTALTDALGNKTAFAYSPLGKIARVVDAKGEATSYDYYPGGKLKSIKRPGGESESYQYDKNGNIVKVTDALSAETSLKYDSLNRVIEIINPLGHGKKFGYDAVGNITSITDEKGNITRYKYSLLGDIIEVIDAAGHSTKYDYDKAGRLTKLEQYRLIDDTFAGIKVPEYQITTYERNKKGEVISVKSPLGSMVKFGYDKDGHVTSKLDEDGLETLYEYNLAGKLTTVSYADGKTAEYAYNPLRQLTAMHDWLGSTKIEVDALGRATGVTDYEGKAVGYEWDSLGRKEKLVYPDGSEVKYEYNPSGRLDRVRSADGVTQYYYDAMGRIIERALPDSTNTKYEVNPLGRLTSLTHSKDGDVLDQFKYTYDPAGNISRIEKQRAGVEADSGLFEYSYDDVGRLIAAVRGDKVKRYRYDELGNRVREWGGHKYDEVNWTQHTYNKRNQLIKTTEGDAVKEYRYDKRGNLTQITENGQLKQRLDFDATNMMVSAFTEGKGTAEYAYNGFRNRVRKLETLQTPGMEHDVPADPVSEVRYTLDMTLPYNNLLATDGERKQSFTWGNGLISASGEENFYYVQDHLGSPIRLVGEDQSDTALAYDEFGVPLAGTGKDINQPFGFTGYQTDDVTGLYYAQARYYSPQNARFISEDFVSDGTNYYLHCRNNPLLYVDLDGLKPSALEAAYMADHVYSYEDGVERELIGGWKEAQAPLTGGDGMVMGVYSRNIGGRTEYALVNKGTSHWFEITNDGEIKASKDLENNLLQPTGKSPDMQASIERAIEFVEDHFGQEVTMIGHSKGGAEAAANAIATGKSAILFNPARPNLDAYGLDKSTYKGSITSYVVEDEALSLVYGAAISKILMESPLLGAILINELFDNPASITIMLKASNMLDNPLDRHEMACIIAALNELQGSECDEVKRGKNSGGKAQSKYSTYSL